MPKILCIPDIHLKPKIFDRADDILESGRADYAVQMGDMLDDFGEEYNISLYERTLQRAIQFHKEHPGTLWVMGNHDYGYYYPAFGPRETGHSTFAEGIVGTYIRQMAREDLNPQIVHIVGNVLFSHAGVTRQWIDKHSPKSLQKKDILEMVKLANGAAPEELWEEDSPIWARPQIDKYEMFPCKLQVVGHTPMKKLTLKNGLLSTDTFSTYRNGAPYGDQTFAIVDTKTGKCRMVEGEI